MSELLVWRDKIQKIYARYSIYIDKAVRFLFAFVTVFAINKNIGVVEKFSSPVISFGLAVVCAVLPPVFTALIAAALVLLHMFKISIGIMAVSAVVFFAMFAFYCQFTPKRALVLLATPIAYMLHVPYIVPIVCGLVFGPVISAPVIFGTIAYYMVNFLKNSTSVISSADGIMGEITLFAKNIFMNKEMWLACIATAVCIYIVYIIRRLSIEHAWFIAIIAGALLNIIVFIVGSVAMGISASYGNLLLGNLAAVAAGLVIQFFLFSVDYSRTETVQFEDDEYYYYVKAIPKITISKPDKVVKRINERNTEEILLEKSLQEEMEIQDIINKELGQ